MPGSRPGNRPSTCNWTRCTKAGCGKVYQETASGAKADRPVLDEVLGYLRPGDTLVVWRLDRLGRSLQHLIETVAAAGRAGDRLQEPDRADRHDHLRRQARLPCLRGAGRVRTRSDPRAHPRRAWPRRGPAGGSAAARRSWPTPSRWPWPGSSMPAGQTDIATICRTLGISRATLYRALKEPAARLIAASGDRATRPGARYARPRQTPPPRSADRRLARGPRSRRQLLPPPGSEARSQLRPRLGRGAGMPSAAGPASTRWSSSSCSWSCSSKGSAPSAS